MREVGDDLSTYQAVMGLGLSVADGWREAEAWVQVGVAPKRRAFAVELHRLLAELATDDRVRHVYFMRKRPGLRLRLSCAPRRALDLRRALVERTEAWGRRDLVSGWTPMAYEPEVYLFGGAEAMECAHATFTVDSLTWAATEADSDLVLPDARLSFAWVLAQGLMDAWSLPAAARGDVMACVRDRYGRQPAASASWRDEVRRLSHRLRAWDAGTKPVAVRLRDRAARHRARCRAIWDGAHVDAVGLATVLIFQWNRARLGRDEQALLLEVL